jgi:hypothetical protein|tara:strand:- start:559 stop:696 length:138 start_codon:yes stop_codon:yes gene_type:complete
VNYRLQSNIFRNSKGEMGQLRDKPGTEGKKKGQEKRQKYKLIFLT